MKKFQEFVKGTSGQGMTEYGLIIALIAIAVFAVLRLLGGQIGANFTDITTKLKG